MNTAAELVSHYSEQLQPCYPPCDESTRRLELTFKSFRAAFRELPDPSAEIGNALVTLQNVRNPGHIDLWLMAATEFPNRSYVPALCELLMHRERYIQHEWIAEILGDLGDEHAIPALIDACNVDDTFDPAQSLAFRCIDSLQQIDIPESRSAIRSLAESPLAHVREYAIQALP